MKYSHIEFAAASSEFTCCGCRKRLTLEELLSFGGTFACEGCVREYYRSHGPGVADSEVRLRRGEAVYVLRRLRSRVRRGDDL